MNTSIIKSVPAGDFEEISIHMPGWEEAFLGFVEQGKRIKFGLYTMPNIPKNIQAELGKRSYCELILEQDNWQHFLLPRHDE